MLGVRKYKDVAIDLYQGDITEFACDAMVNAANSQLAGGGGVDGAIHKAGGSGIMEECRKLGGCPTGEARVTGAHNLPADWVIHTVGPVWTGDSEKESELLRSAYLNSLKEGNNLKVRHIAFPSISTGVYHFPVDKAAKIAFLAAKSFIDENKDSLTIGRITFVLFNKEHYTVFQKKLFELIPE